MKKWIAMLLSALMLCTLVACRSGSEAVENESSTQSPAVAKSGSVNSGPVNAGFEAQYIRTDGYHEDAEYPAIAVIRSTDALIAYYEQNKSLYFLERRKNPAADMTIGFLDACERYDAEFFKEKALVLVLIEEGSGSIRHKVSDVTATSQLTITLERIVPEVGTCDMAQWHIMIAVDQSDLPADDKDVIVRYNGKSSTGSVGHSHKPAAQAQTVSDPISGYCGNTSTTVYFDNGRSYHFFYDESVILTDLLANLDYKPEKLCRCLPEYTVDTEFGLGYKINLTEGFARCNKGQADLTGEQIEAAAKIIEWAKGYAE